MSLLRHLRSTSLMFGMMVMLFLLVSWTFTQADTLDLDDGLVAYYPFDGNADDASGNGNHGVAKTIYLSLRFALGRLYH